MARPRLLDLFCGAGGASQGYHDAGFDVVGVDIKPQPRFPFEFIQADAMTFRLGGFDAYHASPPCQKFSRCKYRSPNFRNGVKQDHPDCIDWIRLRLLQTGKPFVIENVPEAGLIDPLMLCGTMFDGLRVYRHRHFECHGFSKPEAPRPCNHSGKKALEKCAEFINNPGMAKKSGKQGGKRSGAGRPKLFDGKKTRRLSLTLLDSDAKWLKLEAARREENLGEFLAFVFSKHRRAVELFAARGKAGTQGRPISPSGGTDHDPDGVSE